jgi:SAM-dependent methyltransferase
MSHPEQQDFFKMVKAEFPEHFHFCDVLDVGSLDINGSNRDLFEECSYVGCDIMPGANVSDISKCGNLKYPSEQFYTIISGECFEHDMYFEESIKNIVRMLAIGGLFVMTCAGRNRPEHGTRRTETASSPLTAQIPEWQDFYQNRTEEDFLKIPEFKKMSGFFHEARDGQDLYYCGVKVR